MIVGRLYKGQTHRFPKPSLLSDVVCPRCGGSKMHTCWHLDERWCFCTEFSCLKADTEDKIKRSHEQALRDLQAEQIAAERELARKEARMTDFSWVIDPKTPQTGELKK